MNPTSLPQQPPTTPQGGIIEAASHKNNSETGAAWPPPQPRKKPDDKNSPSEWRTWPEISVKLDGFPADVTTLTLWQWLSEEGEIKFMQIFETKNRPGTMSARIIFQPPPKHAFWLSKRIVFPHPDITQYPKGVKIQARINYGSPKKIWSEKSNNPERCYPLKIQANLRSLDFGTMAGPISMNIRRSMTPARQTMPGFSLEIEHEANRLTVYFHTAVKKGKKVQRFKFSSEISQIKDVYQVSDSSGIKYLILPLPTPPHYFYQNDDMLQSFSASTSWSIRDTWHRATDIIEGDDVNLPLRFPVSLMNQIPGSLDLGRWTTFRLGLNSETERHKIALQHLWMALEDFNVKIQVCDDFQFVSSNITMWDYLEHPSVLSEGHASSLLQLPESPYVHLDFKVRYQLEVCVSRGIFNEHAITIEFLHELASLEPLDAARRLEFCVDQNESTHDPMTMLTSPGAQAHLPNTKVPYYCAVVRKAVVTPTTIRFNLPTVETSNRVMRHYNHMQDRFLRVQFLEETENDRITKQHENNDDIWKRLLRTLYQGIKIGDRRYEFLAFGSSQLRQCGVYFFCPTDHLSCDDIRQWMGQFNHIKVIAKYAARLGQCFSTTREMRGIPVPDIRYIPDIERNDYCFSDGVGIISGFLARMIIEEMTLDVFNEPSAFQFRMGGCKGVLVVWPHATKGEVCIRESQEKFKTDVRNLEIIKCARFSTATLNRQTITILEDLGVPIQAFVSLLDQQIQLFDEATRDTSAAVEMLTKCVDENQSTLILAELLQAGFKIEDVQEPFVMNLLRLWRSWSLKILKERARIQVEKSAFVLGCVDETGTLRGHKNSTEGSKDKDVKKLPQIFLQLSNPKRYNEANIIKGICIVGRNPSLHPGDIRVVQAVDNPKLHHLKDVVVFPSTGDRPVPNMLSGGDLDGDDFFIIWDTSLIPKEWNHPAMNYSGPKPQELDRDVNSNDLRNFFVKYMKSDMLGLIATSHLGFADRHGPRSDTCLHLAELHSKAVDYPKTGEPAEWSSKYTPQKWPHFMEKKRFYKSHKALGIIYDKVVEQPIQFLPNWDRAFDQRVSKRFELDLSTLKEARKIKSQYDRAVRRILTQYKVDTEFELYTGWAMSSPAIGSDYKRQEDLGHEYDALKQRFRDISVQAAGGHDDVRLEKFVAAMYKVTEEEIKIALYEHHRGPTNEGGHITPARKLEARSMPLISFPWIFPWVMARIASEGKYGPKNSILAAAHKRARMSKPLMDNGSHDVHSFVGAPAMAPAPAPALALASENNNVPKNSEAIDNVVEATSMDHASTGSQGGEVGNGNPVEGAMDRLVGLVDDDDDDDDED